MNSVWECSRNDIRITSYNVCYTKLLRVFGIIAALEINAIKGKTGPMTSVRGVIHMGLVLTLLLRNNFV